MVVRLIRVRPWGRCIHLGYRGCRWVHSGAPLGTLGSFGVVRFCRVRLEGRLVSLGAVWFVRVRTGGSWAVVGFIRDHWIHLGWPWWSCVHSGTLRVRPGGRLGSFGSFGCALVVVRLVRLIRVRPRG